MKNTKVLMFTTLWALWIASLFLMWSSNANFNFEWLTQRSNPMQSVSEIEDYSEFLETIEWTRIEWKITEEKFNEIKEKRTDRNVNREEIMEAIQNHDFDTWIELHEWNDILEKIDSEEKFEKLIEMHSIMDDARTNMETAKEKADTIADELWIERRIRQDQRNRQWIRSIWWERMWWNKMNHK